MFFLLNYFCMKNETSVNNLMKRNRENKLVCTLRIIISNETGNGFEISKNCNITIFKILARTTLHISQMSSSMQAPLRT